MLTALDVPVTVPTPPSILNVVASLTSQISVRLPPPAGRLGGVAVKLVMVGFVEAGGVGVEGSGQAVSKAIKSGRLKRNRRFLGVVLLWTKVRVARRVFIYAVLSEVFRMRARDFHARKEGARDFSSPTAFKG
jgi:hypothetical protein